MALPPVDRRTPRPVSVCATLLVFAISLPVYASAQSVRVLLAQEAPYVEVRSDSEIILVAPGGSVRARAPLIVSVAGAGMAINGKNVGGDQVEVRPSRAALSLAFPKTLSTVSGKSKPAGPAGLAPVETAPGMPVSGIVRIARRGKGLSAINVVDLEEYVKGVVPSEVSASWHPEMLKVQAVAARTYALYNKHLSAVREYDLVATVQDQVYRGRLGVDRRVEQAVDQTRGLVVTYQNAPIYAAFSSTAAGPTEDSMNVWAKDLPYLKGVECPFDLGSPYYQWKASVKMDRLEQHLREQGFSVGTIATITPIAYSRAGRVTTLRILHSRGELLLRGEDLRKAVGYSVIPSTQFEIESVGADVVFAGYGAGHAVGLCQWGAKELAELGYPFTSILRYYYPGTELRNAAVTTLASPPPAVVR
ncbi:MAG TPA: SpoIID/LytB domain-containing protein [Nitrospiraceae bacterium]|nr:SpoIID/LytB domain-containing protein [Nitrospiraceae bacterium]